MKTSIRGFTLVELMIVVALVAILLALAAPSFRETIARNRVEGVAGELSTDFQYARSEAVARNTQVGLFVGTGCYIVFVFNGAAPDSACAHAAPIKLVSIEAASISLAWPTSPPNPNTYIQFDSVRGMATDAGGTVDWSGSVIVSSTVGNWQLRTDVTNAGRVKTCSPLGTFKGYPAC